jgi:hypothetical protein
LLCLLKKLQKQPLKKSRNQKKKARPKSPNGKAGKEDSQVDSPPEEKVIVAEEKPSSPSPSEDGQLFFSTDGSEPEKPEVNPFKDQGGGSPQPASQPTGKI